jgi:AraC-like DNA-binding protein
MISKLYFPSYPLNQFVESFFYYSGYKPEHTMDRYLPDGNIQIIFDLTDYPKYIYDNDTLKEIQSCKKVWFSGFRTEPITIPSGRNSEMLIVQFYKGKVFPFLNEPMNEFTNYVIDGEIVFDNDILDLRDHLNEALSIEQKFILLEKNLLNHYQNTLKENPFVDFVISNVIASPTHCSLKKISDKVGYSHKHLIKIFRECVGVTPKDFLKIIRFQKAIEEIEKCSIINWTSLAIDCGFYDQSHFIGDFKSISGFTPGQYLEKRGPLRNYIPILDKR